MKHGTVVIHLYAELFYVLDRAISMDDSNHDYVIFQCSFLMSPWQLQLRDVGVS